MCGGTDLIKQDGVFVCQSCGCKYSVDEAKKMMIEGTVDISGSTVKIDRSNEIDNLLKNADTTYSDGNYKEAFDLFSKILNIEPDNPHAIIYRALSSAWESTVKDCRIGEINKASERAYKLKHEQCGDTKEYFDFCTETGTKIAVIISSVAQMYVKYFNKANPRASLSITVNIATAGIAAEVKKTLETGTKNCCIVSGNVVTYMLSGVEDFSEATDAFCVLIKNMAKNCAIYRKNANMTPDASDKIVLALAESAEEEQKEAVKAKEEKIKREQEEKRQKAIAAYWAEHPEEKTRLENEKSRLSEKISSLNEKIESVKQDSRKQDLEKQIKSLQSEKDSLGLFKSKEKKEIQSRIDELQSQLNDVNKAIKSEVETIEAEIKEQTKELTVIETELTKER